MDDISGRFAVVTGGVAGIGPGITGALLERGARAVIADAFAREGAIPPAASS